MYQQLTLTPIGFPILDDLRLALLTQQQRNIWRSSVCTAVCAFIDKKLVGRKETFRASSENIKHFVIDCYGKTLVHYDGGTFDVMVEATKMNRGVQVQVVAVSQIGSFKLGVIANLGEKDFYEEIGNG